MSGRVRVKPGEHSVDFPTMARTCISADPHCCIDDDIPKGVDQPDILT